MDSKKYSLKENKLDLFQSPSKRIKVKRKQWTNEQMKEPLEAVASGETSINQAAKDYGVPQTTLKTELAD